MTKQLILADKEKENAAAAGEDDTGVASHSTKQLLQEESKSHDELTAAAVAAGINPESAANETGLDASESALKDQELDEDLRE